MQTHSVNNDETLYERALELVKERRAASVVLLERHLRLPVSVAEQLMARMAQETTIVRRTPSGLYVYTPNVVGNELANLRNFCQIVVRALQGGTLDPDALRAAALRHGLATEAPADGPCSSNCICAELLDFPVHCFRPTGLHADLPSAHQLESDNSHLPR